MVIHMADRANFLHYMCGKVDDFKNKVDDWTFDVTKVTCEKCLAEFRDRKIYFTLLRKMKEKQKRGIIV